MRYIAGTTTSVKNVAKARPKMIVHANGFQNAALSPPKYISGLRLVNKVAKLIFIPNARGINPSIVDIAVNNTGVRRVAPALTIASILLFASPILRSI